MLLKHTPHVIRGCVGHELKQHSNKIRHHIHYCLLQLRDRQHVGVWILCLVLFSQDMLVQSVLAYYKSCMLHPLQGTFHRDEHLVGTIHKTSSHQAFSCFDVTLVSSVSS